ncbi:McrC family protein [Steroidobacter flavus]|uniref:McrC family protein n=1 Tax=Steroidobacter flavus TaxID=1842136 RepID=A0ABV8SZT8_9GAMM
MSAKVQTLDLEEDRPQRYSEHELSEASAVAISKTPQCKVEFPNPLNGRKYIVRAERIAGLVPISNELLLRIKPKVPIGNVFAMLAAVRGLEFIGKQPGVGSLGTIEQMFDFVAREFAERVIARVRKGLYSQYVGHAERAYVVRGRLEVASTLRLRARGDVRVACTYETTTPDILDNQVILWALDRIARVGLRTAAALERVRAARRALLGTVSLTECTAADCRARSYNRLNEDYRILHALARFFLEAMGPRLAVGEYQFVPFKLTMWSLFQDYVVATIRAQLPSDFVLHRQRPVELGGAFKPYKIDALIADAHTERPLAVIDAKYTRDPHSASEDVNQVVAYATYTGAKLAILVYPTSRPTNVTTLATGIRLCTMGLPLEGDLAASGERFCQELFGLL